MRFIIALAALLALALPAKAQTLAQPAAPNNTVVCITVSSISTAVTLTPAATCFGMTDTVAGQLLAAYAPMCQASNLTGTPPVPTPCAPQQIVGFIASSIQIGIQANVASYLQSAASAAAAAAVTPPTVTPVR